MVWCCWCSIPRVCPCKQRRSTLGTSSPSESIKPVEGLLTGQCDTSYHLSGVWWWGPNRFGYANNLRTASGFGYGSASEHIVKYGASYYIDGGDRGTVKLFSYGTPTTVDVYGLKRTFTVGTGNTEADLTNATGSDPYIEGGSTSGLTSSYYVGSKIITSDPLDQNIEVTYVNPNNDRLYLNAPLNSSSFQISQSFQMSYSSGWY